MPAVMVSAELDHHDNDELATGIKNLLQAKEVSDHLDLFPHLDVGFDLDPADALEMTVEGEEQHVLSFVSRCREEGAKFKAVREDDETHFRLV
ncbi:MAG: hypothetical protein WA982_13580 [Rubrobacteraceae bacterium]